MPPPRGRSTVLVRRPRIRPSDRQETTAMAIRSSYGPSEREPQRDKFTYDRSFYGTSDLNFERGYTQNERFLPGNRSNQNFQNFGNYPGPQNLNYTAQARLVRDRPYPQNKWEPTVIPPQNISQVGPNQNMSRPIFPIQNQPGTSRQPPQNQTNLSHYVPQNQAGMCQQLPQNQANVSLQIRNASQYNQNQNRHKNPSRPTSQASNSTTGGHTSQELKRVHEHYRMYTCPDCQENYTYKLHQTRMVGKLPLILHCSHTVCQECIYKKLSANKIICPVCQHENVLAQNQTPIMMSDLQKPFQPNFHILGMMFFSRPPGGFLANLDNIKLVSNKQKKNELPVVTDRCCFGTCIKEATMYCPNCDGIYCKDCCTVVHKSTKMLMSHEPIRRKQKKFSFKLDFCRDHPEMLTEFYCKDCDSNACCYCVLDHHGNHERTPLYQLTDSEKEEFHIRKDHAIVVLKEVLTMQKKASKLSNFSTTSIKREIATHFANRHAKLFSIEKRLFDEIDECKTTSKGLDGIQASLQQQADVLRQLVKFDLRSIQDQKLNLRGALQKLRTVENEPRFLLNSEGTSEPVRFVNNFTEESETDHYQIVKCDDAEYKLVLKDDLPDGYVVESLSEPESEIEQLTKMSETMSCGLSVLDDNRIRYTTSDASRQTAVTAASVKSRPPQKKSGMEKVEVQHINSMDSFFIQHKNLQSKLNALNKDIENYVMIGAAENVQQPQINSMYLVLYVTESQGITKEQKWCRGKVVDAKRHEAEDWYEVFFIDYGKTQLVTGTRIKDIPQYLLKSKPFAVECKLYNPMNADWSKNTHLTLAKILNGKQIFMVVKSTLPSGVLVVDLMVSSSDGGVTSVIDILVFTTPTSNTNDENDGVEDSGVARKEGYYPQVKVFPNHKSFTKNQTEKVILANVVDPHNVFVHIEAHQEAFKSMSHQIKKVYKHSKNSGLVPIEGTYVLLEYRDSRRSNWHRAFIKNVDLATDQVHAVLVDWGLSVMVPTANIRPMPENLTKLEAQAVLVKLAHIAPFNKQATWSWHAVQFLQTWLSPNEVLKMVVQDVGNEVSVALFDMSGNVPACINALLVENNLADSTGPLSTKCEWPQYDVGTSYFDEEEGVLASMLKKVDEAKSDSGEEDCRQVTRLQIEIIKAVSPDELYVKFLNFRDKEAQLFKEINIHYNEKKERKTKEKWGKDDLCVVELDSQYSRGKILGEVSGGGYKVLLYDKAEEVEAATDKIYTYNLYFGQFANVAIRSHLANIRPAGDTGKWSISSVESLQAIFQKQKRLYACKADEADTDTTKKSMPLDMWYGQIIRGGALEPDHMKYVCINHTLVRLGFAYKKPGVSSFERAINAIAVPKNEEVDAITKKLINQTDDKKEIGLKSLKMGIKEILHHENLEKKLSKMKSDRLKEDSTRVLSSSEGEASVSSTKTVTSKSRKSKKNKQKKTEEKGMGDVVEEKRKDEAVAVAKGSAIETEKETIEVKKLLDKPKDQSPVNWAAIVEAELKLDLDQPSTSKMAAGDEINISDRSSAVSDKEDNSDGSVKEFESPYHRKEVDISDWLEPFKLTKREFRARVTCVETGGHLYLHDESIHDAYETIEENIKEYFDTNPPKTEDDSYWQPGRLCTIKYDDGKWYRGRVLNIKGPNVVTVFMIDFGSDHDVHPDVLYREVLYTDIEPFATKVKLDKVFAKEGVWLSSDYDAFMDLVTEWCQIKIKGPINVEIPLVEVITDRGLNVNEELVKISQNLVRRLPNAGAYYEEKEEDILVIEEVREQYLSDEISENDSNKNESIPKGDSRPTYTHSGGTAQQEANVISCNSMLDWTFSVQPLPTGLLKGEKVLLEVGGVLSYNRIALKGCEPNPTEDFYNLIVDIQDVADTEPHLKDIRMGVPCIAIFSEDGVWYRARISSIDGLPIGQVEVYFVDYGNTEVVRVSDVRALRPDWLEYPQQTWEVRLGFKLKDLDDQEEVQKMIYQLAGQRKFVKLNSAVPLNVDLYDKDELCYQNLVDLGLIERDQQH